MRLIKKLDIFVFRNFVTLFAGTFVISMFVVMMQFLWKYIDELVGKGLGVDVLAKFFFYAAETLVSMALPLAILLASLISFGNMGERLELLAIKAAGVSLWRTLRPVAVLMVVLTGVSYYFQEVVAPEAQERLMTMLYSMKQQSPEVEIPEGVFYDGVQGMNLFVREKDKQTGMLRDVIIYNMRDGVNDAHIILADSAHMATTADKKRLLLRLFEGEQFENFRGQALATTYVPYRRETFVRKDFIIDVDQNLDLSDVDFSGNARTKNFEQLHTGIDSLTALIDSASRSYYTDMQRSALYVPGLEAAYAADTAKGASGTAGGARTAPREAGAAVPPRAAAPASRSEELDIDTLWARLPDAGRLTATQAALQRTVMEANDLEYKEEEMNFYTRSLRMHRLLIWQKLTQALSCLLFFFIGAPLGAIIRKGGLGLPVVVAVVFFIFYYIIDRGGYNLAYAGTIPEVVGMWVSTAVLLPIGVLLTVKSNNDSAVFNMDSYRAFFRRLWGIRVHRNIVRKEVIVHDPDYGAVAAVLDRLVVSARSYRAERHFMRLPSYVRLFFRTERDETIGRLSATLERCVDALSNSRSRDVLYLLNHLPVLDEFAHTAPFHDRRLNAVSGCVLPVGIVLWLRVTRFRRRLNKDLGQVASVGERLAEQCRAIAAQEAQRV